MTTRESFRLIACDARGVPVADAPALDTEMRGHAEATAALYARVGFEPPFVGYIAVAGETAVGGGAFVGPPRDGVVEIAYYTQAAFEGRGYATRTARALVEIARRAGCTVIAHTLMTHNPSTRILGGLGFVVDGTAQDDDAGTVWRWRLAAMAPASTTPAS